MKKLEKYTGTKTYMFPNGAIASPETVLASYPAVESFVHIIETDNNGEVMFAIQNLSAMRSMYGVDTALSESEAIEAIETIINIAPVVDTSPTIEERTAAALEMIALNGMPDVV